MARFAAVDRYLQDRIAGGVFPGVQYLIGERGEAIAEGALGNGVLEPETLPVTRETIYDLASLTKPLVTTLLATLFAERGILDLSAPIGDYLEEFRSDAFHGQGERRLTDLLTHTSGFAAWRPLYLEAQSRDTVVAAIAATPRDTSAAPPVVYSDLNFILLGFILERLVGERLDCIAQREIIAPLMLERTMFNPPPAWQRQTAATELGQRHERATVAQMHLLCPLPSEEQGESRKRSAQPLRRKGLIWGEVHDGNAYFLDGVGGHAGLFSTAREVFRIANQFLPGSQLLQNASLACFTKNFTAGRGDARSIGWMLAATPGCSAGPALAGDAFGHTGFTGTSVWVEADRGRVFVLLANRVHPRVNKGDNKGDNKGVKPDIPGGGMTATRQKFHILAVDALNQ